MRFCRAMKAKPVPSKPTFYLSEDGSFEVSCAGPRFSLVLDQGMPECGTERKIVTAACRMLGA